MNDVAITVKNLVFNFGRLRAVDDLSLEISAGTSFGLLGPNGSGKTTLIRLMVGLLKPASGNISCLGKPPTPSNARNVGYMPQLPALYAELTVQQNIDFFARIYGLRDKKKRTQRVDEVIKLVDLYSKRKTQVMKLSGGMKQRVSLGCAIIHQPPLIFLDEPTVGLDPELRARFWDYFESLTRSGSTIIVSSHTMDDAAHCQKLAFLRGGRVIALGSPAELRAATGTAEATMEDAFLYYIKRGEVKENAA
ncbi:MAG: ABC transporter ATP-binding protein [Dehalococcoidales bacterium]|nr:MAG: ABC transporter ATP-binding protein [Dehalococcoidales bacterium]